MGKLSKKSKRRSTAILRSAQSERGAEWQVQTAKARFSEVFHRARTQGPQRITRQGKEGVVVISDEQYGELAGRAHQPKTLVEFFRKSPLVGVELDLERQKDEGRHIEL